MKSVDSHRHTRKVLSARFVLFIFILSFLALALTPGLSLAEFVGVLTKIEGRVDVLRPGSAAAVTARKGEGVSVGDIVRTKSDGKAEIIFKDKTALSIAPGTRIRIDEYTFNPDNTREQGIISLFRGKIRSVVSKVKSRVIPAAVGTSTYKVKTPTTVMGVKGTDVFVYHKRGFTGVAFREGHGFVYNSGIPESVVNVGAGEVTFVSDAYTPPAHPRHVSEAELASHLKDTTPHKGTDGDENMTRDRHRDNSDEYASNEHGGDDENSKGSSHEEDSGDRRPSQNDEGHDDDQMVLATSLGQLDDVEDIIDNNEVNIEDELVAVDDDYSSIPYTESHDESLGQESENSYEKILLGEESNTTFTVNGSPMGTSHGRAFTHKVEIYDPVRAAFGVLETDTQGSYTGVTVSGNADLAMVYNDGEIITGTEVKSSQWTGGQITGTAYGYGADSADGTTWISVGDVTGTFDASAMTFTVDQMGYHIDTHAYLLMASSPDGQDILTALNVPFAEVGSADLSGTDGNLIVNMNGVKFFAYSTGAAPSIWATDSVSGTFSSVPTPNTTVNLTGGGLSAGFTTVNWSDNMWLSTVDGSGTLSGSSVSFEGAAAGTYDTGSFTGSGAGVVK